MRSVKIPDGLYERLQQHARPFEDEPADVIGRALDTLEKYEGGMGAETPTGGVPERDPEREHTPDGEEEEPEYVVSHSGLVENGTPLRARYKGKVYLAKVVPGAVVWEGQRYHSLSQAAIAVIQSTGSLRSTENGWRFWEYLDDDSGEWRPATDQQVGSLVQKATEVDALIIRYLEQTGTEMAKPKELMPFLVEHGAFRKDHRDGLPLRKLCRELHTIGRLSVMTSAHFDQKAKNKSWYFLPPAMTSSARR